MRECGRAGPEGRRRMRGWAKDPLFFFLFLGFLPLFRRPWWWRTRKVEEEEARKPLFPPFSFLFFFFFSSSARRRRAPDRSRRRPRNRSKKKKKRAGGVPSFFPPPSPPPASVTRDALNRTGPGPAPSLPLAPYAGRRNRPKKKRRRRWSPSFLPPPFFLVSWSPPPPPPPLNPATRQPSAASRRGPTFFPFPFPLCPPTRCSANERRRKGSPRSAESFPPLLFIVPDLQRPSLDLEDRRSGVVTAKVRFSPLSSPLFFFFSLSLRRTATFAGDDPGFVGFEVEGKASVR